MFRRIITTIFFFITFYSRAQQANIKGTILSYDTQLGLPNAVITLENTIFVTQSNKQGIFDILGVLPLGEQVLRISCVGYKTLRIPVVISAEVGLELGPVELQIDSKEKQKYFTTIDLSSDQEITEEENSGNQILLQANRDAFLNSVAFNWSSTFFKIRGLGSEYSKVLINGIEMNSFYTGRPNWSTWSGLNDLYRSQENTTYTNANAQSFGSLLGINQLQFYADAYYKGAKLSLASTNRTYQGRLIATIHSGLLSKGWSYGFSVSGAKSKEGYIEGTSLSAYGFSGMLSKQLGKNHKINFTAIYTPSRKGKISPNTQEVINIKGRKYNSYWGLQEGKIRNSRVKSTSIPIFALTHFWNLKPNITIQNNLLFQKGKIGNSRLDFNGREINSNFSVISPIFSGVSRNPDPVYYQRLPSFFLQNRGGEDFEGAFKARQSLESFGQLDWEEVYRRNSNRNTGSYALYEDVIEDQFLALNTIWNYKYSQQFSFQAKITAKKIISENYAEIKDLLGAKGFLDIDSFSEGISANNNLRTPNRIVGVGDRFRYNYEITGTDIEGFVQSIISIPKWEMYFSLFSGGRSYQRTGLYENGNYPGEASLGEGQQLRFRNYGLKFGITRQISNKFYVSSNIHATSNPPSVQQSFSNPRQNNEEVIDIENQKIWSTDLNLNYKYGKLVTRLSVYYIKRSNLTDVSFFFTENIASLGRTDSSAFVQEITTGIKTLNQGIEFGADIEATSTITLHTSMAYGKHIYTNNPNLYITSDSFEAPLFLGESKLKNFRLANGPQQAYGLGFSYRDPSYWWFNTQINYFSKSFIDISPFARTQNFTTDIDGQPLADFEVNRARELLRQEDFGSYFLWNAIGGKSWRLKNNDYLGFTLGIQNILGQFYKTGGFEQSRNSNFKSLDEDQQRDQPLFGNRYWLGNGTTFYINTFWRF